MATMAVWTKIDEIKVVASLEEAANKLDSVDGDLTLDFSSVRRIEPAAIKALESLAKKAEQKGVKVGLQGVTVEIYRVLKQVKLARRFSFPV